MSTAVADPAPHSLPGSLILTLFETPARQITLRSVELLGNGSRLRVSFTRDNDLNEVINPELLGGVEDLIGKAPAGNGLIALPDFVIKVKDLILSNARLISAPNPSGGRYFSVRFERVFGNLMSFFSKTVDIANAVQAQARSLADLAVNNVYLPLFDFAEFLENASDANLFGDRKRLYHHLSETRDRIRELESYHEALMQVIDEEETEDAWSAFEQGPTPGTRLQ